MVVDLFWRKDLKQQQKKYMLIKYFTDYSLWALQVNCAVPDKIHTHPMYMEGHQKFLSGGRY